MTFDQHFHAGFQDPWNDPYRNGSFCSIDMEDAHEERGRISSSPSMSRSPSVLPMRRYLNEDERYLSKINDGLLAHPFPGPTCNASLLPEGSDLWRRYSSPASSGDTSESFDTGRRSSSRHRSPYPLSADVMGLGIPPSGYDSNALSYTSGGASFLARHDSHADISCVALPEIQKTADSQDESFSFEATPFYHSYGYGTYAQEGYQVQPEEGYQAQPEEGYQAHPEEGFQPVSSEHDSTYYSTPSSDRHSVSLPRNSSEEPVIRRRRAPSVGVASGRVRKQRPASRRAASHQYIKDEYSDDISAEADINRSFPCPLAIYGCRSTFSAKNEWKRHVQTQHLRLGYWRCDQCAQGDRVDRKPNDFNRKDLFVQHVRRMHPLHQTSPTKKKSAPKVRGDVSDEHYLTSEANRCYRRLRDAPDSTNCIFCDQHFHGPCSWEERMEHIGRHMENMKKDLREPTPTSWRRDEEMEEWLLEARIIERYGDQLILVDGSTGR